MAATFSFTVPEFSKLTDGVWSPSFLVQDMPWMIRVKRRKIRADGLSYFICCRGETTTSTWSCQASLEFRIKSVKDKDFVVKFSHLFTASKYNWSQYQVLGQYKSWADLINPENGFIVDDKVTFEVKITAASTVQVIFYVFFILVGILKFYARFSFQFQLLFLKVFDKYCNHLNTKHLKTGFICISDSLGVGYTNGIVT